MAKLSNKMKKIQKVVIKALIRDADNRVLFVKDKGLWELPGGKMELGEMIEDALAR